MTVTDAYGCVKQKTFTVEESEQLLTLGGTATPVTCTDENDGSIDLTVSGGTAPYSYNWSNSQTTQDISGLAGGSYTVTVTDAYGCVKQKTFTVEESEQLLTLGGTATPVTCTDENDGSIDLTVSGGTAPYSYNWSNSQTTQDISGLAGGSYTVTVTDAYGCVKQKTFTVEESEQLLTLGGTATPVTCTDENDGSIDLTVSGGTAPYSYNWSNSQTTQDISGLAGGSYTVTVTDAYGCVKQKTFTVEESEQLLTLGGTATPVTCTDENDGSIDLTVSGGTAPYSYNWSNSQTTQDISGLAGGSYTVTVTDAYGCVKQKTFTVEESEQLLTLGGTATPVTCTDENDGSIDLTVSGGTAPYSYNWSNSQTTQDISGLAGGSYTVTVTDAYGCVKQKTFTVEESEQLLTLGGTATPVTCTDENDGSIDLTVSGGTAPYSYNWSNSQTTQDISGLAGGSYTVTVTDAYGCVKQKTFTVEESEQLLTLGGTATPVTCTDENDGSIDLTVSGGTAPYSYNWSNSQTTQDISGLAGGSYTVTVTDAYGCVKQKTFTVEESEQLLTLGGTATPVTCTDENDGSIDLTVSGGTAPYSYNWSNSQTTQDISGLAGGSYTVTVTDAYGCVKQKTFTVEESEQLLTLGGTATPVTCTDENDGSIDLTVSGGTAPYSYNWSNSQTTQDISGLAGGSYTVTVTDAYGCVKQKTFTVEESEQLLTLGGTATPVTCTDENDGSIDLTVSGGTAPYSYNWSNSQTTQDISGLAGGSYTVTVTDAYGCVKQKTFTVEESEQLLTLGGTATPVTCTDENDGSIDLTVSGGTAPYSYNWSNSQTTQDISGLAGGSYTVTVTDAYGCVKQKTFTVEESEQLLTLGGTATPVTCTDENDGSIDLTVSGGTAPYSYNWSNSQTTQDISGLAGGSYTVTVTDAYGCVKQKTFTVEESEQLLTLGGTATPVTCTDENDGSIDLTVSGGTAPYSYNWSNSQTTQDISGLAGGSYTVTVTDAYGCVKQKTFTVEESEQLLTLGGTATPVTCTDENDGSIDLTVSGGTAPYSYNWSNSQTTQDISGLAGGSYTVTVTDAYGCVKQKTFTVEESEQLLTLGGTATPVTCTDENDGSIDLTVSGGTAPYSYNWSNSQTTQDISGLAGGSYTVTVTDAYGCVKQKTFTVEESEQLLTLGGTATPVTCTDENDGSIDLTVSGGTAPYSYNWSNSQTTQDISGLAGGSYTVTVTDAYGCVKQKTFTVEESEQLLTLGGTATPVTCTDENDGSIDLTVSGGTAPYSYNWSNSQTTQDISGLAGGSYTVTVTDAYGCVKQKTFTVEESEQLLTLGGTATPVTCTDENDGSIDLTVSGGTAPYSYNWSNSQTTQDISGLAGGSYTVTVTDAYGCVKQKTFTVEESEQLLTLGGTATPVTCTDENDGSIDLTVSGGTAPYSYNWSNSQTTQDISGLAGGSYTVTVTDAYGCVKQKTFTVEESEQLLTLGGTATPVTCTDENDGSIDLTVSGGTAPYSYNWSNSQTTQDISGLAGGSYTVTVTDAYGCVKQKTFTVEESEQLLTLGGTATPVTCTDENDGSIDLTVSGGTAPYSYNWSNSQTTQDISGLAGGSYTVTVTDAYGCVKQKTFTVEESEQLLTLGGTATPVTCTDENDGSIDLTVSGGTAPYSYNWSNSQTTQDISGLAGGSYTVTVTDAYGCVKQKTFTVEESEQLLTLGGTATPVTCTDENDGSIDLTVSGGTAPYSYNWSNSQTTQDISGLAGGSYTVTVTDAYGCVKQKTFTVEESEQLLTLGGTATPVTCTDENDGSIDLTVSGGTAPYSYNWSNSQTTQDISGLAGGSYTVTVTDAYGCVKQKTFTVEESEQLLTLGGTATPVTCTDENDGSIDLTVSGGTAPYSYNWSNSQTTQDISGLAGGSYTVTVTDAYGCVKQKTFTVEESEQLLTLGGTATPVTCTDENDGSIDLTVSGGTAPYSYNWSNSQTTQDISGLAGGSYTVTVTDAYGCVKQKTFTVEESEQLLTLGGTATPVTCTDENDGSIDLTVSGGTAPYSYNWSNSQTTQDISGLAGGSYTVTVTDAYGCVKQKTFTVEESEQLLTLGGTATPVTCTDENDGSIDLTVSGGTAPYSYNWSNSQTTQDISGLAGGSYTVTVTDAYGCVKQKTFTVEESEQLLTLGGTATPVTCTDENDGSIDLTVSGGTAPYSYNWSNSQTTQDISGLAGGSYTVTVTDYSCHQRVLRYPV